jgi:hypothetical protein
MLVRTAKRAQRCYMSVSLRKAAIGNFVTRKNIKRYRRLAGEPMDFAARSKITRLLAGKEAKFKLKASGREAVPERR